LLVHKDEKLSRHLVEQITNDLELSGLVDVEARLWSRTEPKFFDGCLELSAASSYGGLDIARRMQFVTRKCHSGHVRRQFDVCRPIVNYERTFSANHSDKQAEFEENVISWRPLALSLALNHVIRREDEDSEVELFSFVHKRLKRSLAQLENALAPDDDLASAVEVGLNGIGDL